AGTETPFYSRGGVRELRVQEDADEPVGRAALERLADRLDAAAGAGGADAGESAGAAAGGGVTVRRESGDGVGAVYVMMMAMPFAEAHALQVGRIGDDLLVTAGGVRRRVRLAPVLRRCTVREAEMGDGVLRIRFRPDPEVWPL